MAWTIIEIETASPGRRTSGAGGDDGAPVAWWALVENEAGASEDGYVYRAPLS